jgi:hypothetical protein
MKLDLLLDIVADTELPGVRIGDIAFIVRMFFEGISMSFTFPEIQI